MGFVEALIFDLDGLLIDSEMIYHRVSYEMAAELDKPLTDEILAKQMARSPVNSMQIFINELGIKGHSAEELVDWRNQLMIREFRKSLQPMKGALEILQHFQGRLPMAIATGSQQILLNEVMTILKIEPFFDVIQTSDLVKEGKPNPEIYLRAAERLGLAPDTCVVLEDTSTGSLAGKRAGCYVIAIPNNRTENQDFSFVDVVLPDLIAAKKHIENRLSI